MRSYITSVTVGTNGTLQQYNPPDASVNPVLTLRRDNALIGLHIVASANWDMSQQELDAWRQRFEDASQVLFNATDGQVVIERLALADQADRLPNAEYRIDANTEVWPHSDSLGGYLGSGFVQIFGVAAAINVPRSGYGTDPRTLVHEFGHLGFEVLDEYAGVNVDGNFCSVHARTAGHTYTRGTPAASCIMDREYDSPKFCSGHRDNPHKDLTWQENDCWTNITGSFGDRYTGGSPKWTLKTPVTRNAIIGTVEAIPVEWASRVTVTNHRWPTSLCEPFQLRVRWEDGSSAAGLDVALVYSNLATPGAQRMGPWIMLGMTSATGRIDIVGAHASDVVQVEGAAPWGVGAGCRPTS